MTEQDWLAERFEAHRTSLRGVAFRMLGSLNEADDAVQEAWLRLSRSDSGEIANLGGWLTTVVARVCLDMLRSRASRREELLPSPIVEEAAAAEDGGDPEHEAVLADGVGLALLVVLDRLTPAERIAFVLHDLFGVPFAEIAPVVERSPVATKKLASRARRRVRGGRTADADLALRRRLVDAYLAAARGGDMRGLLEVLDPDVVRRADRLALPAGAPAEVRGARAVAEGTRLFATRARLARPALVDGAPGLVVAPRGRLELALAFGVEGERIVEIDVIADPERLRDLDLAVP
jgi:RNA polymerase sigma-70 factor (ECF subfamily)